MIFEKKFLTVRPILYIIYCHSGDIGNKLPKGPYRPISSLLSNFLNIDHISYHISSQANNIWPILATKRPLSAFW